MPKLRRSVSDCCGGGSERRAKRAVLELGEQGRVDEEKFCLALVT